MHRPPIGQASQVGSRPSCPYNFAFHQRPCLLRCKSILSSLSCGERERMVSPFAQLAGLRATAFAARD